jgi:hypothetical protein
MNLEINKTKGYITPLLNQHIIINKELLANTYLYDINHPELNVPHTKGILVLMKYAKNYDGKVYESNLIKHELVLKRYDVNDDYYMLFVKISIDIANDVKLILDSKYSKIQDKSKQVILRYWQQDSSSKIYRILNKVASYKKHLEEELNVKISDDAELGSSIDFHKETFNVVIKATEVE